jgi:hypothetical protein
VGNGKRTKRKIPIPTKEAIIMIRKMGMGYFSGQVGISI